VVLFLSRIDESKIMVTEIEENELKEHSEPTSSLAEMFRSLGNRNFRLFWIGALLSNVGTWMQAAAQGWLVQQLTNSPFWLGVDNFMALAPGLFLTLLGGVFADLVDRKRMLIFTQIGAGLSALTLGTLVALNIVRDASHIWIVLMLSFATGCCMALAGPSFQSFLYDLVGREDLSNAIALNSAQFQLSRVVGPAIAGVVLAAFGMAICFFGNAASYIAIVIALSMVRFKPKGNANNISNAATRQTPPAAQIGRERPNARGIWRDLLDGFRYVKGRPRVLVLLSISAVISFCGAPYTAFVPYFAQNVFHLGEKGFATMMSVLGGGAFIGALTLTILGDFRRKGWSVLGGAMLFSLCLIGFSMTVRIELALAFIFGMGFSVVSCVAVTNMLLQQLVTDEMRGRVMSMFILTFVGAMPIGSLLMGFVAQHIGAPRTLTAGGAIIFVFILSIILRDKPLRDV
jgi:predicted MFS family arabinose efflux permease